MAPVASGIGTKGAIHGVAWDVLYTLACVGGTIRVSESKTLFSEQALVRRTNSQSSSVHVLTWNDVAW